MFNFKYKYNNLVAGSSLAYQMPAISKLLSQA
jgi:hypothetical protein